MGDPWRWLECALNSTSRWLGRQRLGATGGRNPPGQANLSPSQAFIFHALAPSLGPPLAVVFSALVIGCSSPTRGSFPYEHLRDVHPQGRESWGGGTGEIESDDPVLRIAQ